VFPISAATGEGVQALLDASAHVLFGKYQPEGLTTAARKKVERVKKAAARGKKKAPGKARGKKAAPAKKARAGTKRKGAATAGKKAKRRAKPTKGRK
jgi:GTP-binding protein